MTGLEILGAFCVVVVILALVYLAGFDAGFQEGYYHRGIYEP